MSGNQKQQQSKQTQTKANTPKAPEQNLQGVNLEQLIEAPETMRSEEMLAAQQRVGNQVVQRALDGKNKPQATLDEQGYLNQEISSTIQKKRGGGSPLPDTLRKDVSKRLKHDFDDVRIHTDEQANEISQSINARAFTIGKDIFFKKGVFAPGSSQGRETIMHELTHVVQQSGGSSASGRLKLGAPDTSHEKQADKVGKANSSVDAIHTGSAGAAIQKQGALEDEELMQGQPDVGGILQRESMPEEDELQMQPDAGVVQRESPEEDELQMQPDAGVVQRESPEEDDLQMQPDASVIQREEMPEEEMMMQPDPTVQRIEDEDELQAQPDAGGLVQRKIGGWEQGDDGEWGKRADATSDPVRSNNSSSSAPSPAFAPGRGQNPNAPIAAEANAAKASFKGQLSAAVETRQARKNPPVTTAAGDRLEEVQTQPDTGGVVQREGDEDDSAIKWTTNPLFTGGKKTPPPLPPRKKPSPPTTPRPSKAPQIAGAAHFGVTLKHVETKKSKGIELSDDEKANLGKGMQKGHLLTKVNSRNPSITDDEKKEAQGKLKTSRREELTNLIKDPKTDPEKVKEAQEELKTFHKRGNALTGLFKKSHSRQAMGEREKAQKEEKKTQIAALEKDVAALQQKAEGGHSPDAFKAWKEKKAELDKLKGPSTTQKIGSTLLGGAKSFFGSSAGTKDIKEQFLGKKEEKKEEAKKPDSAVAGGGGGYAMLEKYITENQQLKAKVAELEKEKAPQ